MRKQVLLACKLRLDIDEDKVNSRKHIVGTNSDILLDGKVISNVVAADEDEGYLVRVLTNKGNLIIRNGEYQTEVLRGDVCIRLRKDAPDYIKKIYSDLLKEEAGENSISNPRNAR